MRIGDTSTGACPAARLTPHRSPCGRPLLRPVCGLPGLVPAAVLLVIACSPSRDESAAAGRGVVSPIARESPYAGTATCAECHAEQARLWRGSDHDLALQPASEATVLGDFAGATFDHAGVRTVFSRRDSGYWVRTEGPDGAPREVPVTYTFGVAPLQQYLVPFRGGRLQALPTAWDSRPASAGGQRWFHMHADEPPRPGEPLHWTGHRQTWNLMCADCHSTALAKRYDPSKDAYTTSWEEPDVACEACHGPGSRHVAWARAAAAGDAGADPADREPPVHFGPRAVWVIDPATGIGRPSAPPPAARIELETCAPCHSRRSQLRDRPAPGGAFLDAYRPALLDEGLYFADGQIQDEVYEYGSFLQSRMYAAGVTCSDCHDPHSLALPEPADAVCARCHAPERFASPAHHRHPAGSPGASCVACHMPQRTYMVVDPRHDHSFRVPRPDLSPALGVPHTCSGCHADRGDRWAAAVLADRVGSDGGSSPRRPHYGQALYAGREELAEAASALLALAGDDRQPGLVRATALTLLDGPWDAAGIAVIGRSLADPDPLVRFGAVIALRGADVELRARLGPPLLDDPLLTVRLEAGRLLAAVPTGALPAGSAARLESVLEELREAERLNEDWPEGRLNLGNLALDLGDLAEAEAEYRQALALDPSFVPAAVNLAEALRHQEGEAEAEQVLREALRHSPETADAHHALGLLLVRTGRAREALGALESATRLAPGSSRYAYALGLALHGDGNTERALAVLDRSWREHTGNRALLVALATISRDAGRLESARRYARALEALTPPDPTGRQILAELDRGPGAQP